MPIIDLYSSRRAKGQPPADVWEYIAIPQKLRVQVSNIVEGALGPVRDYGWSSGPIYKMIADEIAHEHGRTT